MIRFIDLGEQITDEHREFAWFDTVADIFIDLAGDQEWETWEEFEESYNSRKWIDPLLWPIERFKGLFPKNRGKKC